MEPPPSLKKVKPYIDRANELKGRDPVVAYHCRLYALDEAMKVKASIPKQDMGYILGLMDECEAEKKSIGEIPDDAQFQVENFGQQLFQNADDADRNGQSNLQTAKVFKAASYVLEATAQFGELPADISEKIKYAKYRTVEIARAVKEGREPEPPRKTEEDDGGGEVDDQSSPDQKGSDEPPSYLDLPSGDVQNGAAQPALYSASSQLPSYIDLPSVASPTRSAAQPPVAPQLPVAPQPPVAPQQLPAVHPPPGFKPATKQMVEASRLCSTAMSALQFQDSTNAVNQLMEALRLLTQPVAAPAGDQ